MGDIFSYITILGALFNSFIAFFLAHRLNLDKRDSYLNEQLKYFFVLFGAYYILASIVINATIQNPYLFFVLVEISHFVLFLALAFILSAFVYLKYSSKVKTVFWLFIIAGFAITLTQTLTVNPYVSSIHASIQDAYSYGYLFLIPKALLLTVGFIVPAGSLFVQAITTKDKDLSKKSYLFSFALIAWMIGGSLHSQFTFPSYLLLGDIIMFMGFVSAGFMLLGKK